MLRRKIIMSRQAICVMACILVACHSRHALVYASSSSPLYDSGGPISGLSFLVEQNSSDQQPVADDELRQDSIKRIVLKGIDSDGDIVRQSDQDLWRLIRLDQVLEALSSSIPTPAPIYRSGRTYPSSGNMGSNNRQTISNLQVVPANEISNPMSGVNRLMATKAELDQWQASGAGATNLLESRAAVPAKSRKSGLLGIVWPPNRPLAGGTAPFYSSPQAAAARKSQSTNGRSSQLASPSGASAQSSQSSATSSSPSSLHHRIGTEEVALHTPIHLHSASDYEWKRVENSRWNNLRGMWGKRAINERYNDLDNFRDMLETEARDSGFSQNGATSGDAMHSKSADEEHQHQQPIVFM